MRYARIAIGVGLVLALGAGAGAEQGGTVTLELPPLSGVSQALRFAAPWQPEGGGSTMIVGTVIDSRQMVVARVKVRLRNITTGEVIAETESNDDGEYSFTDVEPGLYVVEMLFGDRYVVALSNAGSVARFETLQTVIQLPGRWDSLTQTIEAQPAVSSFMGMSAATTLTAATLVTAVTEQIPTSDQGVEASPSSPQ
jgi:Carboxypeptidase regulatory-like domain